MPEAARRLREDHKQELASSTDTPLRISQISVSTLLAGREFDASTEVVKTLDKANAAELI